MAKQVDSTTPTSSSRKELGKTDQLELPPGWVIKCSKTKNGMLYYYNTITNTSSWEKPHSHDSDSISNRQDKLTSEEKQIKLKDKKSPPSEKMQSGLSMIALNYTKQKDNHPSDFSSKRKVETVMLDFSPTKVVKSKNISTEYKGSQPAYVKSVRNVIQSEQIETPVTIPPLVKKQNVKSSRSSDIHLQENEVNKKATKRSRLTEVSAVSKSVKESFTMARGEIAAKKKKIATARRRIQKNASFNDRSQNVSHTSDSVNKILHVHGGNKDSDYNKNKIAKGSYISTDLDRVKTKMKEDSELCSLSEQSKKNLINTPINALHNVTTHTFSPAWSAKTFRKDNNNDTPSYESLLNQSSSSSNKPVCRRKEKIHVLGDFNTSLTSQFNSDHMVQTHILTNSSHHNKNYSTLPQDDNLRNNDKPKDINKYAVDNNSKNVSGLDKWHYSSPLNNRLEIRTRSKDQDFRDDSCNFTGQPSSSSADVEQDIEDMEVDEEGLVILSNLQDVRTQTSSTPNEPRGILTETVMKTKPSSLITHSKYDIYNNQVMLVIDTNVLISCLRSLQEVLTCSIPGCGIINLVIPWVVMQELDYLKSRKNYINNLSLSTSQRASKAIKFIHSYLVTEDPRLIGQTPIEANEETEFVAQCNDDRILQCCVQFQRKCVKSQVVLVTRDVNLINRALIMGIKGANNETLWSLLKIPKPHFCTAQMSNEVKGSTSGTPERQKQLKSDKIIESNSPLQKQSSKCEQFNRIQQVDVDKVLRDSSTTSLRSSPLTVNCNLPEDKLFLMNANSVITKVPVDHKRLPQTPAEKSFVMNKFEAVWKLIYDIKLQIGTIVTAGKSHINFIEAVQMLQVIKPLLSVLQNNFSRCMSLSPIILWDQEPMFSSLCTCLNTFFMETHTSCNDPSQPVEVLQLIKHFSESGNRPTLFAGLEQLSVFVTEVEGMIQMCS